MRSKWILLLAVTASGIFPAAAATPTELADQAASLSAGGRYEEALTRYEEALNLEPANAGLYLSKGLVYQAMGKFEDAIRAIETAARLDSRRAQAHYSLALLYEAQAIRAQDEGRSDAYRRHLEDAQKSWNNHLNTERDPGKQAVARKHLEDLRARLRIR